MTAALDQQSTALREQVSHSGELTASTTSAGASSEGTEAGDGDTSKRVAMIILVLFVLYVLMNGLSLPSSGSSGPQRRYKPVSRLEGEQRESDDEEEEPGARRRMMELASFGGSRRDLAREGAADPARAGAGTSSGAYHESRQPQSERGAFPMTSFGRAGPGQQSSPQKNPPTQGPADEEAAAQLQRELELFAQEDGEDEDAALIALGDPQ